MTSITATLEAADGTAATLENVLIEADVDGLMAIVNVRQRYRNRGPKHIEAVYTFPLPLDGALLALQVELGDRRLSGAVIERAAAAKQYEEAITDGDAAVLLEQPQPGLYTASVGNLAPGETATVRLRYGLLLRWNGDRVGLVLPTTIAPRYGDPASGGLEPHHAPAYGVGAEQAFRAKVSARGVLSQASWTSPSHHISVASEGQQTTIALDGAAAMDRDLVLEARSNAAPAAEALVARDGDGWVALASFRPEMPRAASVPEGRVVKIVVDCSGSMSGDSIAQVRVAGERILNSLGPADRFDIVAFGSTHRALFGREAPATATNLAQAQRFVGDLDADLGGTGIEAALDATYRIDGETRTGRNVLLITDGEAWDTSTAIEKARASGHRIFTVGVGSAVAEPFVRALAEATGGACELVAPRADLGERIHRHFQRIGATPVRAANLRWPAPALRALPDPLPPPFPGDTMHLFGWFAEPPNGTVVLEMALDDGATLSQQMAIGAAPAQDEAAQSDLARLAAARRLGTIDDEVEATALAVRYQLMSEWTNYLVVHVREAAAKADGLPDLAKIPQMLPAGWHGIGTVHSERVVYESLDVPAMRRRAAAPEVGDARVSADDVQPTATAAEFFAVLSECSLPAMPAFDELVGWLPGEIRDGLAALVDSGADAECVVVVFLYLLSQSDAGQALDRRQRRVLLAAWKKLSVNENTVAAVRRIAEAWTADDS